MKLNLDKFNYGQWSVREEALPSVTRILSGTKDDSGLETWRKRVGEDEAKRIMEESANRGKAMHKMIEARLKGHGYEDLTPVGQEARPMAGRILDIGLTPLEEIWGLESHLVYPDLYHGYSDLLGIYNGKETVIDFKQANRPKKVEWIEDYYLQAAAYAMAHDHNFNTHIEQAVILVCTKDLLLQTFSIEGAGLGWAKHAFLKRLGAHEKNPI